jgi:[acyl-carrier-protein] S-malonyltransferase
MSPPMHSAAFAPLRDTIERELLSKLRFSDPTRPLVSDHDGCVLATGEQVRRLLLDGITRSVQWPKALGALADLGVQRLCVAGPDGLWGRVASARSRFDLLGLTPALALRPRSRPRSLLG